MKKIDLHGVKHADVQRQLDVFLWEGMQKGVKTSTVVTGNSIKMKELVTSVAQEYGFKVIQDPTNEGSVIVQM